MHNTDVITQCDVLFKLHYAPYAVAGYSHDALLDFAEGIVGISILVLLYENTLPVCHRVKVVRICPESSGLYLPA